MNRLGVAMLMVSIQILNAMNSDRVSRSAAHSPSIRRAQSDSGLLPEKYQLSDSSDGEGRSASCARLNELEWTPEDTDDELDPLSELPINPSTEPLTRHRGIKKIRVRVSKNMPLTQEGSYADIVRLIQYHSRAALVEARMLNKQHIDAVINLLTEEIATMSRQVSAGVTSVEASLIALNGRLAQVEQLLPQVRKLLEQEKLVCDKYDDTCRQLRAAFETYATNVTGKEITIITLVNELIQEQREAKEKLSALDARTRDILTTTRGMEGTIRSQLWKDTFMSACAIVTSLGVLTFIISHFLGGNQEPIAIETNAS